MRIDKFLKVSRIIKRRSIANQACTAGAVKINGKQAKSGTQIKAGDIIEIELGTKIKKYEVADVTEIASKELASEMYREI